MDRVALGASGALLGLGLAAAAAMLHDVHLVVSELVGAAVRNTSTRVALGLGHLVFQVTHAVGEVVQLREWAEERARVIRRTAKPKRSAAHRRVGPDLDDGGRRGVRLGQCASP